MPQLVHLQHETAEPAASRGGQARCVVWRPRGTALPGSLSNALTRPDFKVTECDNQYEAFASLCKAGEPGGQTVLLLVEPKTLPAMSDVGDAVDRYAPDTTLWVFETMPSPQIPGGNAGRPGRMGSAAANGESPGDHSAPGGTSLELGHQAHRRRRGLFFDEGQDSSPAAPSNWLGEAVGPNNSGTVVRPISKGKPQFSPPRKHRLQPVQR